MKRFRFILSVNGISTEVNPLGIDSVKLKSEPEGENIFFRRKFSGTLKLQKEDFALLYALEKSESRCNDILFNVEKLCGGIYRLEWPGTFSLNEVKWNVSRCEAEIQVRPNDVYRCILDNYSKEHNLLEVPVSTAVQASVSTTGEFQFLFTYLDDGSFDQRDDVSTWATFLEIRNWQDGTVFSAGRHANEDIKFRQIQNKPYVNGQAEDLSQDGWQIINDDPANQIAYYARPPAVPGFKPFVYTHDDDFYGKYPDLLQIDCNDGFDPNKFILVKVGNGNCIDIRTKKADQRLVSLIWEFGTFYFTRNRNFLDSLRFLVQKTCPEVAPQNSADLSQFFSLPVNYVTNKTNKLRNMLIAQKSDVINYKSSEAATKGMMNLKTALDELRMMFDVRWFINAAGKFQIEHISYFSSIGVLDFTEEKYALNVAGKFAYEYERAKMPRYERLKFSEATIEDFKEGLIEYSGACVNYDEGQDTKEETISTFTTDLDTLVINGENASKTGFVLMVQAGGQVDYESGDLTGATLANGHLSAANLLKHYHNHLRIMASGKRNNKPAIFASVLKTKKQVSFSVDYCCDLELHPFFRYITEVSSNGSLASSELNLKTNVATIETIHETAGSGLAVIGGRQFSDSFDDSFR